MLGLKVVAKLCEVNSNDGNITAFDSHEHSLFIGTDVGYIQKLLVRFEGDNIFTTHIRTEYAAEKKKKIARIVYSTATHELFVLSARRLMVFDSALNRKHEIASNVGVFSVSVLSPQEKSMRSGPVPGKGVIHRICASEKHSGAINVFEYTDDPEPLSVVVRELFVPEPALRIVETNGIMCVGLQREYSMVSVKDGDAKSLMALNGRPPAMVLGEHDVYLRLLSMLFVVSMKQMPTGRADIVRRTIPLHVEPTCFAVRSPYVFALSEAGCEVYSNYESGIIESVAVTDCTFITQSPSGDCLFAAGKSRVWMMQTHPLDSILRDLIERYKVADAFDLLSTARRNNPGKEDYDALEVWLNVLAGFAELYHGNSTFALGYFNDHIDVREILLHCPDLIPEWVKKAVATAEDSSTAEIRVGASAVELNWPTDPPDLTPPTDVKPAVLSEGDEAFLKGWYPQHEYNRFSHDIAEAWEAAFLELPSSNLEPLAPEAIGGPQDRRLTPETGDAQTKDDFIRTSWRSLKEGLIIWLQSRLPTSEPPQRRAIEYALLVLFLQCEDYRSAWRVIENERFMHLMDAAPVLLGGGHWRAMCLLLRRKGMESDSDRLWKSTIGASMTDSHSPHGLEAVGSSTVTKGTKPKEVSFASTQGVLVSPDNFEREAMLSYIAQTIGSWRLPGDGAPLVPASPDVDPYDPLFWAVDCMDPAFVHDVLSETALFQPTNSSFRVDAALGSPAEQKREETLDLGSDLGAGWLSNLVDGDCNNVLHLAVVTPAPFSVNTSYDLPRKLTVLARLCDCYEVYTHLIHHRNRFGLTAWDLAVRLPNSSERQAVLGTMLGCCQGALLSNRIASQSLVEGVDGVGLDSGPTTDFVSLGLSAETFSQRTASLLFGQVAIGALSDELKEARTRESLLRFGSWNGLVVK